MRVLGDTGTVTQALITGNVDAMVVPYSYADMAKRAGARALADVGKLKFRLPCNRHVHAQRQRGWGADRDDGRFDQRFDRCARFHTRSGATNGMSRNRLRKIFGSSKDEDVEAAYRVSRLQMPNLDVAPNLDAWRTFKRLVAKINPKVQERRHRTSDRQRPSAIFRSERFHGGDAKTTATMKKLFTTKTRRARR